MQPLRFFLAAFGLMAFASMMNVACSASGDIDSGSSESNLRRGAGAYGDAIYADGVPAYDTTPAYSYFGTDIASDCAYPQR